jgi:hypothetical protein
VDSSFPSFSTNLLRTKPELALSLFTMSIHHLAIFLSVVLISSVVLGAPTGTAFFPTNTEEDTSKSTYISSTALNWELRSIFWTLLLRRYSTVENPSEPLQFLVSLSRHSTNNTNFPPPLNTQIRQIKISVVL